MKLDKNQRLQLWPSYKIRYAVCLCEGYMGMEEQILNSVHEILVQPHLTCHSDRHQLSKTTLFPVWVATFCSTAVDMIYFYTAAKCWMVLLKKYKFTEKSILPILFQVSVAIRNLPTKLKLIHCSFFKFKCIDCEAPYPFFVVFTCAI